MIELIETVLMAPTWSKIVVIIGLCVVSFAFMAIDKFSAVNGMWRVSEANLLLLAFLGGAPGAKIAQSKFRHKTRKEPFRQHLNIALGFSLILYVFVLGGSGLVEQLGLLAEVGSEV